MMQLHYSYSILIPFHVSNLLRLFLIQIGTIPRECPPIDYEYPNADPHESYLRQQLFDIIVQSCIGEQAPLSKSKLQIFYTRIKTLRTQYEDSLTLKLRAKFAYYEVSFLPQKRID